MIKLWLGPAILWILVNDPKSIQKVLLSPVCLEKPFFYKFLRLDSGLISAKCKYQLLKCVMCEWEFDVSIFSQPLIRWCLENSPQVFELLIQLEDFTNLYSDLHRKCAEAGRRFVGKYRTNDRIRHVVVHDEECSEYDMRLVKPISAVNCWKIFEKHILKVTCRLRR